ncbi:MAG: ArgE/DapE family deacylase [Chloroflexota bacterium]|nr:ArgE/DapE family deacylase [Chloroflexota bacterium]
MPDMHDEVDRAQASAIINAVDANVDRLVSLTQSLVSCRSDSQSQHNPEFETEANRSQDIVADWLDQLGFTVERWQQTPRYPVVAAHLPGSGHGRSLAFNGHVDVVPGGDRRSWSHDPWAGEVVDGRLWGRGAADMKGGVACALMAAWVLREADVRLAGDLWLHIDADEEVVGQSLRELLQRVPQVDAALVAEPTDLAVLPAEGGLVHLRIEVAGRESHAGNRYRSIHAGGHGATAGINAIEKGMRIATALQDLERQWANLRQHPLLPPGFNSIMPGMIAGGPGGGEGGQLRTISNPGTAPDYCSLEYNIWFLPGETLQQIQQEIESYVADVCRLDPWLRDHPPRFTWKLRDVYFPPAETPVDHPFVEAVSRGLTSADVPVRIEAFQAASELAWYAERGIPGVIFGPGRIAQAHGPNEYVEVHHLVTASKVMALAAAGWCGIR